MLTFWALVIWGIVVLARGTGPGSTGRRSADEVLADRFAAGEIDEDEYRHRLEVLRTDEANGGTLSGTTLRERLRAINDLSGAHHERKRTHL
jgi:putative membrane protein